MVGLPTVTLPAFEEAMRQRELEGGELSSISGSNDEDDDDEDHNDDDDDKASRLLDLPSSCRSHSPPLPTPHPPPTPQHHHPKVFFRLLDGRVASLYRAFLFPKADKRSREEEMTITTMVKTTPMMVKTTPMTTMIKTTVEVGECSAVETLRRLDVRELQTAVILTGGGHFAAAVFKGDETEQVREKQLLFN